MALAMSADFTGQKLSKRQGGIGQCRAVATVFRFDCDQQIYRTVGRSLNGASDNRSVQKTLKAGENTLKAVMKQTGNKAAPPLKATGKTYKPMRPDTGAIRKAAFKQARQEAVSVFLRVDRRAQVHFQRIANVVETNKVVLPPIR